MTSYDPKVLQTPEFWGVAADDFQIQETHLSEIYLVGEFAYKRKKPVQLYFVDTQSLENRKFFCQEEIRLNQEWAPGWYLSVETLCLDGDQLRLGEPGTPVDYLVKMRRWTPGQQLDHQTLPTDEAANLAIRLAQLQRTSPAAPETVPYGDPSELAAPALLNFQQVEPVLNDPSDLEQLEQLKSWADEALKRLWPRMSERKDQGRIREIHGDLYAGHLIRDEWGFQPVDRVEYRSEFRWVDVISEIANLVMDFEARGQKAFANRLINAWLETTGDYHGMWVYLPYKAYRAMVRAKSALLELEPAKVDSEQASSPLALYRAYAERAESYTQVGARFIVITHGTIGCGKGELSNRLVEQMGVIRLRSDVERRRLNGVAIDAPSDAELDAGMHGREASDEVYQVMVRQAEQLLRAGYPVMVSGSFLTYRQRERFKRLADAQGVNLVLLKCEPPGSWVEEQIHERAVVAQNPSEANLTLLKHQRDRLEPLTPEEETFTRVIDPSDPAAVSQLIDELKASLQPNWFGP